MGARTGMGERTRYGKREGGASSSSYGRGDPVFGAARAAVGASVKPRTSGRCNRQHHHHQEYDGRGRRWMLANTGGTRFVARAAARSETQAPRRGIGAAPYAATGVLLRGWVHLLLLAPFPLGRAFGGTAAATSAPRRWCPPRAA